MGNPDNWIVLANMRFFGLSFNVHLKKKNYTMASFNVTSRKCYCKLYHTDNINLTWFWEKTSLLAGSFLLIWWKRNKGGWKGKAGSFPSCIFWHQPTHQMSNTALPSFASHTFFEIWLYSHVLNRGNYKRIFVEVMKRCFDPNGDIKGCDMPEQWTYRGVGGWENKWHKWHNWTWWNKSKSWKRMIKHENMR